MNLLKGLSDRFNTFLDTHPLSECIDKIQLTGEQKEADKADYFFNNRQIVCELKTLKTDSSFKTEEVLKPYREREEWPLIFGKVGISVVVVVHTAHFIQEGPNSYTLPIFAIANKLARDVKVEKFVDSLMQDWGEFDRVPIYREDWADINYKFIEVEH